MKYHPYMALVASSLALVACDPAVAPDTEVIVVEDVDADPSQIPEEKLIGDDDEQRPATK